MGAHFEDKNANGTNSLIAAGSAYSFKNCIVRKLDTQTVCNAFTWIDGKTYTENKSYFNSQKINLSITESPGIYIVNIVSDGKKAVIKVIKD
ncbi:MAG: T9SS type A sorting domain-containing protein [Bacteroidia bacterium]|nr:T9SS type A sorting domain-containing protein [Bacteroidia bacterium]